MMVNLKRLSMTATETLGCLMIDGKPICWTLELPWKNNRRGESCIPIGHYHIKRFDSPRFEMETFKVYDLQGREVAGRDGIIIHAGNTVADTEGCILLGLDVGMLKGQTAILQSKNAVSRFMDELAIIQETDLIIL